MRKITLFFGIMLALSLASCDNKTESTSASQPTTSTSATSENSDHTDATTPPSQQTIDELNKAVTEEHADPEKTYSYDASTNTVIMVKEVDLTADQIDDLAEFNKLVDELKKSTKPADTAIKDKGANIIVHYVNKADKTDTIADYPITPEELK